MANKIFYQEDCNLSLLEGKTIAIIGYGSQGHAHALNLKESGCNVIIGLYEGSKSWKRAEEQGFQVFTAAEAAKKAVKGITEDPEVGTIYQGTVKRIMDFGAFVEILPGKEGLCHISKLSKQRVNKVTDVLTEGQVIPVKLLEVDKQGRLNLSYIDALDEQK